MKKASHLLLLFLLFFTVQGGALEVEGRWKFFGFIYEGREMPPMNPDLRIEFEFSETEVWLTYWREDESGHCRRKADYQILSAWDEADGHWIYQKITWVDPDNYFNCSNDVDMRLGYESWTPILRLENELRLKLPLGDNNLIYRFYYASDE